MPHGPEGSGQDFGPACCIPTCLRAIRRPQGGWRPNDDATRGKQSSRAAEQRSKAAKPQSRAAEKPQQKSDPEKKPDAKKKAELAAKRRKQA